MHNVLEISIKAGGTGSFPRRWGVRAGPAKVIVQPQYPLCTTPVRPLPQLIRGVGSEPGNLNRRLLNTQHRLTTQQVENSEIMQPVTLVSFFFLFLTLWGFGHFSSPCVFPNQIFFILISFWDRGHFKAVAGQPGVSGHYSRDIPI